MYFLRVTPDAAPKTKALKLAQANRLEIAGSSPELLVRVTQGKVEYRPIAGTRKRSSDEIKDQALADEMIADEKERSEQRHARRPRPQ